MNTLLKDDELEPAFAALAAPYAAGLDALIVADLGLGALVREAYPALELHASTQLGTHSSVQLERLASLGYSRAILARELSLDEIAALAPHGLALETFVHGALCYGYSGACLLSSMVSGRSGNRGRCSQACRMRYGFDLPGRPPGRGEADLRRVLSTADLAAIEVLPELLAAGVTSFKIEGRMKDPAYVATTTAVYREALDAALADPAGYRVRPEWLARLEQSFSRGFTTAHLKGRHAEVRAGGRAGHRGVQVGRVEAIDEQHGEVTVRVDRAHELHAADVVQVYTVWGTTEPARLDSLLVRREPGGVRVVLRLGERVSVKDRVFRTSSGEIDAFAADAVSGRVVARPVALTARLAGRAGDHPCLSLSADGEEATVRGSSPLTAARTASLTAEKARRAVGALGGTPYELREFEFDVDEGLFLAVGDLKELRRRALASLGACRLVRRRRAAAAPASIAGTSAPGVSPDRPAARPAPRREARLFVILRIRPNEPVLATDQIDAVCLDLRSGDDLDAVRAAAARARERGLQLRARSPEVLFDADLPWARAAAALGWDAVYARHAAALDWSETALLDYPLQGMNAAPATLLDAAGLVVSPELALDDIGRLTAELHAARAASGPTAAAGVLAEALVFGREQVLVSRDTLGLAEGLAPSSLTDAKGYTFPVFVAPGETRIFNARVSNLCGKFQDLIVAGVTGAIVVQADLAREEREAFAREGLAGLARFDDRERFTTGHLYRGAL